jgi:hypothetical protein
MNEITVITGLPRSGTTLMMRMVAAAGIEVYYDKSKPLEFTENGVDYVNYNRILRETEKIKHGESINTDWMDDCVYKCVKILNPGKVFIPQGYRYRFIWMDRNLKHMTKSVVKWANRSKNQVPKEYQEYSMPVAKEHKADGIALLKKLPGSRLTVIRFKDVINRPKSVAVRVCRFLGIEPEKERLAKMVQIVVKRPLSCLPYMLEEEIYVNQSTQ